jgi:isoleucyl-tRNA synthetase
MVIAIDTEITNSLKLEGYARDIIRAIQDMRKEADYQVTDRISLHIYGNLHSEILSEFHEMITSETLSKITPLMINPDIEKKIELDTDISITIQIEK